MLPDDIKTIGIFRALQLGDLLCSIPAVRALRARFPNASISIIGLAWQKQLPELFPGYFDSFIRFPGYPGLPEQMYSEAAFIGFKKQMKSLQFDLLLQMQGDGSIVNEMLGELNARILAGFTPSVDAADDWWIPYPCDCPEPERHVRLMQHLGIPCSSLHLEFPTGKKDMDEYCILTKDFKDHYVCIHPGSRGAWRQWPPVYFAKIADICYEMGFTICITGTASERKITCAVLKNMHYPAHDFTGITSLGTLGCLISNANLLVANCTGVSHIASATQTPSIIISMDGEPMRWGPVNRQIHHVIDWTVSKNHDQTFNEAKDVLLSLASNSKKFAS